MFMLYYNGGRGFVNKFQESFYPVGKPSGGFLYAMFNADFAGYWIFLYL
jgi:hypothetical protein